jgi:hypothetical protein
MRALRLLLVSAVACGALLALVPESGAGASVPAANRGCAAYTQLQKDLAKADPSDASSFNQGAYKKIGAAFKKAAKNAPKQVKSAMTTLGSIFSAFGGSNSYAGVLTEMGKNGQKFTKALSTYSTYYATNCS